MTFLICKYKFSVHEQQLTLATAVLLLVDMKTKRIIDKSQEEQKQQSANEYRIVCGGASGTKFFDATVANWHLQRANVNRRRSRLKSPSQHQNSKRGLRCRECRRNNWAALTIRVKRRAQ